jgi:hypothetical protein
VAFKWVAGIDADKIERLKNRGPGRFERWKQQALFMAHGLMGLGRGVVGQKDFKKSLQKSRTVSNSDSAFKNRSEE